MPPRGSEPRTQDRIPEHRWHLGRPQHLIRSLLEQLRRIPEHRRTGPHPPRGKCFFGSFEEGNVGLCRGLPLSGVRRRGVGHAVNELIPDRAAAVDPAVAVRAALGSVLGVSWAVVLLGRVPPDPVLIDSYSTKVGGLREKYRE